MGFISVSAPLRQRDGVVLSADNPAPDRFALIDTLRRIAPLLGLKPPVLATLDALLSCLPPTRSHHTVFASNATLVFRRNGITERTLRRHVALLDSLGLLRRIDSPNRKRFMRQDSTTGTALRFGFDLGPLFDRFREFGALAETARRREERIAFLRNKLRVAIHRALEENPAHRPALEALAALRRKLAAEDLETLLETLPEVETQIAQPAPPDRRAAHQMSATNGQNVRHHQKSKKEPIREELRQERHAHPTGITLPILLDACPEAAELAPSRIETAEDVIRHAETLAPMMGIAAGSYHRAKGSMGALPAAVTVWAILALGPRIRHVGAYFHAVTQDANPRNFDPWRLVRQLHAQRCSAAQG